MSKVKQLFFLLVTVILFSTQLSYAQTTAAINGTVVDQNGAPLPGASVIAVHVPSGTQFGTSTRTDGRYNVVNMRVGGPYKVTVTFVGYTQQVEEGFSLALGQNLKIDFKLPEQAVQLSGVTVTAERGAVMSQNRTGAAQNVSLKQIEQMPTLNRSFSSFTKLSPLFSGTDLKAAGRSSKYNNIQIDGSQYNDLFGLGSSGTPGGTAGTNPISFDAISEFQILVSPFDVRYGGFTGSGINAITRSGTNAYSGSAYFYGRNESMVGKRNANTEKDAAYPEFKNYQYGFRLGGPVIKDKLFFFVNGEITTYTRPINNVALDNGFGVNTPATLANLADQFAAELKRRGIDPGSYGSFSAETPSAKLLIKLDYNLSENHQLSLRNNYVDAYQDNMAGRGSTNALSFDSYNYRMKSITNSTTLQLNSRFGNNVSNDLIVGYTTIRDHRENTGPRTPLVVVKELGTTFTMTAGFDNYSGANQLDQDIFEVTDNLSYFVGKHTFTVGTHNEFFSFRNLYIRNFYGNYTYNSIADFQANKVASYFRTYSRFGSSNDQPDAKFNVAQLGFYVQDEWAVLPSLKITYGVRVDIPIFPTTPARNDSVSKYFPGRQTDIAPSGNLLWSPRIGFNWDVSGDRSTQIRGGIGIFTGRVPYVWMSNNYGNSGMLMAEVSLAKSGTVLPFIADPEKQYYAGDPRLTKNELGTPNVKSEIDLADPDLKMPQLLRFNLGIDQEMGLGFIGSVDVMYSKTVNDMLYRKLNLNSIVGYVRLPNGDYEGSTARPIYGGLDNKNNNFNDVLEIYNTSGGYQYNIAFQIQRNVARGISLNAGYNYQIAKDRNSVNSSQAQSQMRYMAVTGDPNSPAVTTSDNEIRNRLFLSGTFTWEFFKNAPTSITLFYNGQSGRPFSFTTQGSSSSSALSNTAAYVSGYDLNGDNYDGNDLFYIPRNEKEILLGSITNGSYVPATAAGTTWKDLDSYISNNDYLNTHRGKIAERNGSTAPWQYYLDMHIQQDIPDLWGFGAVQLYLDVNNVLNLLNPDWGRIQDVGNNTVSVASYRGRVTYNGYKNVPVYSFTKPTNNTPYTYSDLASRWQMQFGVRYSF